MELKIEAVYGEWSLNSDGKWEHDDEVSDYELPKRGYCFLCNDDVEVGNFVSDGCQAMTVVKIGSDYKGVRELRSVKLDSWLMERAREKKINPTNLGEKL